MPNKKETSKDEPELETTQEAEKPEPKLKTTVAKAGKRSAKAIEEVEEKLAKEERKKAKAEVADEKPKKPAVKPARSRLERRAKSYRKSVELIDKAKLYSLEDAVQVIGKTNPVKFDATVELHVRLEVDPKQADQNVRDNVLLPSGSGKTIRVAAFVDGDNIEVAKKTGADLVGEAEVIKELDAGSFSFDVLISTPAQMPKLGKYARILGPRGMMPNPKSGTVTTDIAKAVTEAKAGKVEYRVDSGGNIHVGIGKVSFKPEQLLANLEAVVSSIKAAKPASIKGNYVISAFLSTSMGPSIKLTF